MKNAYLLLLLIFFTGCAQKPATFNDYTASVHDFQDKLNREFANKEESPLTEENFKTFKSLDFFPINSMYRVVAKFELEKDPKVFEMPTTTDRKPLYKKYGTAIFELNGRTMQLSIYQNQDLIKKEEFKNYLFIPYTDKSSGIESYGGGRYIDLEKPEGDTIIIDFNTSYNPYCAYNHKYSCPIPPKENDLPVAIYAGVKAYNH